MGSASFKENIHPFAMFNSPIKLRVSRKERQKPKKLEEGCDSGPLCKAVSRMVSLKIRSGGTAVRKYIV